MASNANANLLITTAPQLIGSAVQTGSNYVEYMPASQRTAYVAAGSGVAVGLASFDEVTAGYTSNAGILLTLTGTTAQTIDVTNITGSSLTGSYAGTNTFTSKVNEIILQNIGTANVTMAAGSSNGLGFGNATTNALTIYAGATVSIMAGTGGFAVATGTKNLTFTPAATTNLLVYLGGT